MRQTKLSMTQILRNEPWYFPMQAVLLPCFALAPWLLALFLPSDTGYLSSVHALMAVTINFPLYFSLVTYKYWPRQRLIWAALSGLADVNDLNKLTLLLKESKPSLVARIVAQGGFFASVGEGEISSILENPSSDVNTLMKVGGMMQEYKEYEVLELNGDRVVSMKQKLSPSRMVGIRPGSKAGSWYERPMRRHLQHLHLYVLGTLRGSKNIICGGLAAKFISDAVLACLCDRWECASLFQVDFLLSFGRLG